MVETYTKEERISDRVQELVQERHQTLTTYDRPDQLMRLQRDGSMVGELLIGFEIQRGDWNPDPDVRDTTDVETIYLTLETLTALYTEAHADVEAGKIDRAMGGGR